MEIASSFFSFQVKNLDDEAVAVALTEDLRARLDEYVSPGGLVIGLGVSDYLLSNLVYRYVSIAIALGVLVFLLNPVAVLVALVCNTAMAV